MEIGECGEIGSTFREEVIRLHTQTMIENNNIEQFLSEGEETKTTSHLISKSHNLSMTTYLPIKK
jgi:hypothetical protein